MEKQKLARKLVELMKTVENVPKNGFNAFHQYAFAQEADIARSVRGKMAELGIIMLTSVESASRQGDLTEVHTLHTFIDSESGEKLEVKGYGQGHDKGDKGAYKAQTGAVKYAILKNLLLPTGDDPESEELPSNGPRPGANGRAPKKPETNGKPSSHESSPAQQASIKKMAQELDLDVDRDIMDRMKLKWPPNKKDAERIIRRLQEKKKEKAGR